MKLTIPYTHSHTHTHTHAHTRTHSHARDTATAIPAGGALSSPSGHLKRQLSSWSSPVAIVTPSDCLLVGKSFGCGLSKKLLGFGSFLKRLQQLPAKICSTHRVSLSSWRSDIRDHKKNFLHVFVFVLFKKSSFVLANRFERDICCLCILSI